MRRCAASLRLCRAENHTQILVDGHVRTLSSNAQAQPHPNDAPVERIIEKVARQSKREGRHIFEHGQNEFTYDHSATMEARRPLKLTYVFPNRHGPDLIVPFMHQKIREYVGQPVTPRGQWILPLKGGDSRLQPWLTSSPELSEGAQLQPVSFEIKAFEKYMCLTPAEHATYRVVASEVAAVLKKHLPDNKLTLLGSRSTGLATPFSDIDFSISMRPSPDNGELDSDTAALHALRVVISAFRDADSFKGLKLVYARVPVVKIKHRLAGLNIQIQTMSSFKPRKRMTTSYLADIPSVRPLYILLRHALQIRDLTTVYRGGLGSYSLFVMIVTALKHSNSEFAADDLGGQLLHVLNFWGFADLYKEAFSVNPVEIYEKHQLEQLFEDRIESLSDALSRGGRHVFRRQDIVRPYLLCLHDPAESENDLGRNTHLIKHIQETFKAMHASLLHEVQHQFDKNPGHSRSFLHDLVGANYVVFERQRQNLQRFGGVELKKSLNANREELPSSTPFSGFATTQLVAMRTFRKVSHHCVDVTDGSASGQAPAKFETGRSGKSSRAMKQDEPFTKTRKASFIKQWYDTSTKIPGNRKSITTEMYTLNEKMVTDFLTGKRLNNPLGLTDAGGFSNKKVKRILWAIEFDISHMRRTAGSPPPALAKT